MFLNMSVFFRLVAKRENKISYYLTRLKNKKKQRHFITETMDTYIY